MRLCRVEGHVVSTARHPAYAGRKLLIVQPLDGAGGPTGASYLAVDCVQAGAGDRVLVVSEGNAARQLLGDRVLPIRSVVVAIVDRVDPG